MSWSIANHRSLAPFFSTIVAWGGGGLGGMMTDRQLLEHHTPLQKQTLYAEVWALRVLARPSHVQLASLFLVFRRCCAPGLPGVGSV